MVIKNINLSLDEYLNKIKPYLKDIIIILKADTSKIKLTIAINSISSNDTEGEDVMHTTSHTVKSTPYNGANEVVNALFESLLSRYQDN